MPLTSQIFKLAEAVTAAVNAGTFSQTFTAEQLTIPEYELPDLATLKVGVVPSGWEIATITRKHQDYTWAIDVGVLGRVDVADLNSGDAYALLAEEIALYLAADAQRQLDISGQTALFQGAEISSPAPYDPESMREKSTYLNVVTISYKLITAT